MTDPRPSLAMFMPPGITMLGADQSFGRVEDGWRSLGYGRRWRVPVTDHALCVTSFRPARRVTWCAATETP